MTLEVWLVEPLIVGPLIDGSGLSTLPGIVVIVALSSQFASPSPSYKHVLSTASYAKKLFVIGVTGKLDISGILVIAGNCDGIEFCGLIN